MIRELRHSIVQTLKRLQDRATHDVIALRTSAQENITRSLSGEAQRLEALGRRNGSARRDEIDLIRQLQSESVDAVARAEPQLQGIRVVVAT